MTSDLASIFSMAWQLSLEQRCQISAWQKDFLTPISVQCKFEKIYGFHTALTRQTIYSGYSKFFKTGSVLDKPQSEGLLLPQLIKTPNF